MRLVVSVTTLPSRVHRLGEVARRILDLQTRPPDAMYLVVPRYNKRLRRAYPALPDVPHDPRLIVVRPPEDQGPITKLVPVLALERDPATLVVTIDDDNFYDANLLRDFEHYAQRYPGAALGRSGWHVGRLPLMYTIVFAPRQPVQVDFIQGTDGCAYPRASLPPDPQSLLHMRDNIRDGFFLDDVVISAAVSRAGHMLLTIPGGRARPTAEAKQEALSTGGGSIVSFAVRNARAVADVRRKYAPVFDAPSLMASAYWWRNQPRCISWSILWLVLALTLLASVCTHFVRRR